MALAAEVALPDEQSPDSIDFNRDIRSILSDKCFHCHGPDSSSREADLRLDVEDSAKEDRGGYAAIVPGKPEDSAIVARITSEDESERMPPEETGKKLSPKEIALLTRWVKEGAPWSLPWTYVAPQRHDTPQVKEAEWPFNWVDQFVLARLESQKVKHAKDADKVTLIRRLYIDLIGLPPKPEEVAAFLADESEGAYERVVDRLLVSPHFGERMAIYWLDLVRYADTVGYHGDQEHVIAPYRDYVITAFNRNLPFDQFTREQLAGDLLDAPTTDQIVATGYNRLLQTSHEGGVQPKEYLAIYAADRVRNLSAVWMGATMGCAQCHDHKFDPYTMKDFYSMQAFFADVDEAWHLKHGVDRQRTKRLPEMEFPTEAQAVQLAKMEGELAQLESQLKRLSPKTDPKKIKAAKLDPPQVVDAGARAPSSVESKDNEESSTDDKSQEKNRAVKELTTQIAVHKRDMEEFRSTIRASMITRAVKPRVIRILPRGNWMDDSGEIVQPAVPEFLGKVDVADGRATRLDLARWLTDAKGGVGGLTARVMANRFWYLTFGSGLSRVLDDFGGQGEAPCDLELLDSLAVEFIDSGWDVKHMMKLLVMSHAYRQSSASTKSLIDRDPLNRLFARQSQFRYPAEVVRDSTLSISGLLVPTVLGDSVRPYQPPGYYRHLNFPEREYVSHHDDRQWRRGVYMHWQRQYLHPMLKAFDAPSREECTAERPRSNTPLAALVLLNDPSFVEAARSFAARIMTEAGDSEDDRFTFGFRWAVSRSPDENERQALHKLLEDSRAYYRQHPEEIEQLLSVGLKPTNPNLDRSELAAWTIVARVLLSSNEALTRN